MSTITFDRTPDARTSNPVHHCPRHRTTAYRVIVPPTSSHDRDPRSETGVELGLLLASDAEVIGPLHNRLWRETYAGLLAPHVLERRDDATNTQGWRLRGEVHERTGRSPEGAVTGVARTAGRAVGWISVGPPRDPDAPAPVEVWGLYVAPEHQRSGVGSQLMTAYLDPGPAYLWVLDGNERAIAFYRARGFDLDGATKPLGDDDGVELRMTREP